MALLELAIILLAFGAMAVVFAATERAEWRRLVVRADEVLARQGEARTVEYAAPAEAAPELREAA
jgi:hypothetical protein